MASLVPGDEHVEHRRAVDVDAEIGEIGGDQPSVQPGGARRPRPASASCSAPMHGRRRIGRPVRRLQAAHAAAFLVDQDRRVGAADGVAEGGGERADLVGVAAIALKQDQAEGLLVGEEADLARRSSARPAQPEMKAFTGHAALRARIGLDQRGDRMQSPPAPFSAPQRRLRVGGGERSDAHAVVDAAVAEVGALDVGVVAAEDRRIARLQVAEGRLRGVFGALRGDLHHHAAGNQRHGAALPVGARSDLGRRLAVPGVRSIGPPSPPVATTLGVGLGCGGGVGAGVGARRPALAPRAARSQPPAAGAGVASAGPAVAAGSAVIASSCPLGSAGDGRGVVVGRQPAARPARSALRPWPAAPAAASVGGRRVAGSGHRIAATRSCRPAARPRCAPCAGRSTGRRRRRSVATSAPSLRRHRRHRPRRALPVTDRRAG